MKTFNVYLPSKENTSQGIFYTSIQAISQEEAELIVKGMDLPECYEDAVDQLLKESESCLNIFKM